MKAFSSGIALACLTLLSGCDWIPYAFMNSIPFRSQGSKNPDVYVYIGVDGVPESTAREAISRGYFKGFQFSRMLTNFPGSSDASWTRILHTQKMDGYEFEYFEPTADKIVRKGLKGQVLHMIPSIASPVNFEFEYLSAFDFHSNGYTHQAGAYGDSWGNLADTYDNIFYLLGGRAETSSVFSAYVLETDPMGHMKRPEDVLEALINLGKRIEKFKAAHPERNFHFTILSDHGMDFVPVKNENLVVFADEMKKIGIEPVDHLQGRDPKTSLYAIPIMHVRVSYFALHTHPDLAEEVARRSSTVESIDLAVSRLRKPVKDPGLDAASSIQWYAIWAEGKLAAYYGFDPRSDRYYLPSGVDYGRIDVTGLTFDSDQAFKTFSDEELFAATKNARYPDLFYRVRTSLSPVGIMNPADVLLSFRLGYVSAGFKLPGADSIATAAFHGALDKLPTVGLVLTEERDLPDAVRADTFLELFPRMKSHIRSLGIGHVDGDPNASLLY